MLAMLRDGSAADELWPVFVEKYGRVIFYWCSKWGASREDAEDILQMTLLQVFLKIELFEHGGSHSFRNWLRQIAKNIWLKIVERTSRTKFVEVGQVERLAALKALKSYEARNDLLTEFDRIACEEIRNLACERVRKRVNDSTWQAFVLSDFEKRPGHEIAERLGLSQGAARVASFRVRNMLKEEIAAIDPASLLLE